MLVNHRVIPSIKFSGTHLYTWVERGTVRVKCLAQEHNNMIRPGLKAGPLTLESNTLTMRSPHLIALHIYLIFEIGFHNMSTGGRDQENGKTWKQTGLLIKIGHIDLIYS